MINALPPNQRTVLVLAHFEGLPYKKIACILGVSEGAIESRLVRLPAQRVHRALPSLPVLRWSAVAVATLGIVSGVWFGRWVSEAESPLAFAAPSMAERYFELLADDSAVAVAAEPDAARDER